MIPKIIHYCWLSNDPFPKLVATCIESWEKVLPDYEIKKWDMTAFDVNSVPFVKEACEQKKWAFAADYIRLYALYHHGGIYLDSDVLVKKNFDPFLANECFSSMECTDHLYKESLSKHLIDTEGNVIDENTILIPGIAIQAAVIGSVKGNPYIHDCLSYYNDRPFILANGELNNKVILPNVMAFIAGKYGFKYINREQLLQEGVMLYPSDYFAGYPDLETRESYAIHCCCGSWRKKTLLRKFIDNVKLFFFIKRTN
ncbi:glycosyl transferase [Bacteroidia bacterium]|nr:glycosyl transferase [Bacteroidia bacterium]